MKYTFGKTIAAQRIEVLLNENPSARRKISAILSQYTSQLLKITSAKDPATVRLCMELLRDYTLRRIDIKSNMSEDIRSYAKNVIITRYRTFRRCFDDLVPLLEKMEKKNDLTSGDELV